MTSPPLVDLTREIAASPETVWSILTNPESFSAWMDGIVTFEPAVGSPFRAEFPNFHTVISGEVVSLDNEELHLGMTWGVESGAHAEVLPAGSSLVEFRVRHADGGCTVEVRHSQLPSEEAARQQKDGWTFHLSRMALRANRADLEVGLERSLAGWFAAWNEQDGEARLETLRACCAEDVQFSDDWTTATGVDLLNLHISNCFMYMPGWKLEPTGDVSICRGEALVGWRGVGQGGDSMEGINHMTADPDGTIRRVAGFHAA